MASKQFAQVEQRHCVSCGSCVSVCPKDAIRIFRGCFAEVNRELCIGCGRCTRICPAGCITLLSRTEVFA
ncbi:MAG: 4Fe-4S binding protein [Stomatobaculum sp.]